MSKSNNIFLIGPMGVGKTTIGRQLAKKLSIRFYDSDHEIEQRTGADIPLIFEIEAEEGFRKRESQVIAELALLENIVLSTGGGAVVNPENRQVLLDNGLIIYLKSTPEKLFKRMAEDKRRPLLQSEDRLDKIKKILVEREPVYLAMANEIIDTDKINIKQIIQKILKLIENKS
ncbi:MAG: shikimate kinase AroK [Proteobacteria bacterium]|nr:shikimate kinase AroK [Pseudomonadota bacterium]